MATHHFTVDVEEYFQVSALANDVARSGWARRPGRVRPSVERLLAMLAESKAEATFFVLGWVAKRQPSLIREIAAAGHEVASHGWGHRKLTDQTPHQFRRSIRSSKRLLEDLTGEPVIGYRAPSFSLLPGGEWAFDILAEEGYRYDSSLFPIRRPGYGYPDSDRFPFLLASGAGALLEVPLMTLRRLGVNLPAAGGAYFRLFPYWVTRAALRQAERERQPGTFYIHPWELDPGQPRLTRSWSVLARHYVGLGRTETRLQRLLSEFRFTSIRDSLFRPKAERRIA